MNNHLSPKAPKPLLWPQTPFLASPPLLRSPRRFFVRRAYFLILFETVSPPRRSRAPNRPICSRGPPPRRSRAPNRPICSRDPLPTSSRAPNRPICSRDPHPASSRAPNRLICSRDPHPASSRAPNRLICSRDPHPAPSRAPNRQICSRGPHPAPSRAPNRQICSRDPPPPSIPESVDESILSPDKFVIKPDVIRIAVLLTEVGEGIFTARSRVARFAVSLNE